MLKFVVAGSTGQIGTEISDYLAERKLSYFLLPGIRFRTPAEILNQLPPGNKILINCIGSTPNSTSGSQINYRRDNIDTLDFLEQILKLNGNFVHLIHMSSWLADFTKSDDSYAESKYISESKVRDISRNLGISSLILRIPTLWKGYPQQPTRLLSAILNKEQILNGDKIVNIITPELFKESLQDLIDEKCTGGTVEVVGWKGEINNLIKGLECDLENSVTIEALKKIVFSYTKY